MMENYNSERKLYAAMSLIGLAAMAAAGIAFYETVADSLGYDGLFEFDNSIREGSQDVIPAAVLFVEALAGLGIFAYGAFKAVRNTETS